MEKEDEKYSILDELSRCKGYDIALMTTFNFDVGFFERAVFNKLCTGNVKKVSLFVDSKELNKAIQAVNACHMGKKYMVTPVEMAGSFHPKLILLLGQKRAKLFVGSANITTSGYANNNEIFNFIEYSAEQPQYLDVINEAIDFFDGINANTAGLDASIIKEAKSQIYYHKTERNGECFLLQNLEKTILEKAGELIQDEITEIRIAVPYYDNALAAYSAINDRYKNADIILYIQDKKSTFPIDLNDKKCIAKKIRIFSGFENAGKNCCDNFYHGKVFLFKSSKHDYILYGSANCTQSALLKSFEEGGNIECDFFEVGVPGEFDYFFESLRFISGKELESNIMTYETATDGNFFFRYGKVDEGIELHIGYRAKKNNLKARLRNLELDYQYINNELVVKLSEEYMTSVDNIFDLSLGYDDTKEQVRCWYYNYGDVENYRAKQGEQDSLDSFDFKATGDKFIEDRINLLKAELTSLPEIMEYKKNVAVYNQLKQEQEELGYESQDDDFIVDVAITDEYRTSYRQYNLVSKIRHQFVRRFMFADSSVFRIETSTIGDNSSDDVGEEETHRMPRGATTEEKRFERFVKNKVKGMLNDKYAEIIEPEHYLGIIEVILDIFKKYKKDEFVEDIFNIDYVLETRLLLFSKLIGKELDTTEIEDFEDNIIAKSFSVIIDNHIVAGTYPDEGDARKVELANKNFLLQIEKKYRLRDCYPNYIRKSIALGESAVCIMGFDRACYYIEDLYDYKNLEKLRIFIQKSYENAVIEHKGKTFYIAATTECMREHYRPELGVLREITKYGRYVSPVDSVVIDVTNVTPNPENKNIIVQIKHHIFLRYHTWNATEIRADGSKRDTKSQFLTF